MKFLILLLIISFPFVLFSQPNDIYYGSKGFFKFYFDYHKRDKVIEIANIKFGLLDILENVDCSNIIAKSECGKLYKKKNKLYYQNKDLKLDVKLKKIKYDKNTDAARFNLYQANAYYIILNLKDSLKFNNYKFDWTDKTDYLCYRDSTLDNYTPKYLRDFYDSYYRKSDFKMGIDSSLILNNFELAYFNEKFDNFDFTDKKVCFFGPDGLTLTNKQQYFNNLKENEFDTHCDLYIFNKLEKEKSGYDAAIVFWSKKTYSKESLINTINSQ